MMKIEMKSIQAADEPLTVSAEFSGYVVEPTLEEVMGAVQHGPSSIEHFLEKHRHYTLIARLTSVRMVEAVEESALMGLAYQMQRDELRFVNDLADGISRGDSVRVPVRLISTDGIVEQAYLDGGPRGMHFVSVSMSVL